jgi:predicted transcriptional regulator
VVREFEGDNSEWSEFAAAAGQRQRALILAGRSAHMLAAELEALGGASASDERLLSRMGWTRARAVQVLGELEKAGLVTTSSVKAGQGRPKKIYKVVSPAQFGQRQLHALGRAV